MNADSTQYPGNEMKQLALEALDSALRPGVTYADVRLVESRERDLSTKNGKPGQVSSSESAGLGIRVLAEGCWGFAATDDLSKAGVESAAALAWKSRVPAPSRRNTMSCWRPKTNTKPPGFRPARLIRFR